MVAGTDLTYTRCMLSRLYFELTNRRTLAEQRGLYVPPVINILSAVISCLIVYSYTSSDKHYLL